MHRMTLLHRIVIAAKITLWCAVSLALTAGTFFVAAVLCGVRFAS